MSEPTIRDYVQHKPGCDANGWRSKPCTCGLDRLLAALAAPPDSSRIADEDHLDIYVPGTLRCPHCEFQLVTATLFARSGDIGLTRDQALVRNEGEPCPNDGTPMVKVRWSERALEAERAHVKLINDVIALTGAKSLPDALDGLKRGASQSDPDSVLLSVPRDEVEAVTAFLTQRAAGGVEGQEIAKQLGQLHRYTITSEGASLGYFRLVEDAAGAWVTWAEVEAVPKMLAAPSPQGERPDESPVLAFQVWVERYTATTRTKLTQDQYFLAQSAFFAAHPGKGPTSQLQGKRDTTCKHCGEPSNGRQFCSNACWDAHPIEPQGERAPERE